MPKNKKEFDINEFVFDLPDKKKPEKKNIASVICVVLAVLLAVSLAVNGYFIFFGKSEKIIYVPTESDYVPNVDTDTFPLLASVEERNLYLYGTPPYGVILINDGVASHFDWISTYDGMQLPEMYSFDIDRDGAEEIVVIEKTSDENGESQHGVHIVKFKEHGETKPIYYDAGLDSMGIVAILKESVNISRDSTANKITVSAGKNSFDIDHVNNDETRQYLAGAIGRTVEFKMNGSTVSASVSVDVVYDDGTYDQIGTIETEILYDPEELDIKNTVFVKAS